MKIGKNTVVSLSYQLRYNDAQGEIIETVAPDQPLVFVYGTDQLIPGFEEGILNLEANAEFSITLPPAKAYGETQPFVEIPKTAFLIDGEIEEGLLTEGNVIHMSDPDGNTIPGVVAEVKDESVMMDFNHPLAGETLHFQGTILSIREATKEEAEFGVMTTPSCHSGGCEGGCCHGGGCEDGCCH